MTAITEFSARDEICRFGRIVWERQWVTANDGNLSIRIGDRVVCTPTGVSKGFMAPEDLALVDLAGEPIDPASPVRASSEVKLHLRVYQHNPQVGAVVHLHPMFATIFALAGTPLTKKLLPETVVALPEVPLAPYATPSTDAVPDSIEPFVRSHNGALLEQHGSITWGPDLMTAYLTHERLEYTAKLTYLLRLAGIDRELGAAEIADLYAVFGAPGGA